MLCFSFLLPYQLPHFEGKTIIVVLQGHRNSKVLSNWIIVCAGTLTSSKSKGGLIVPISFSIQDFPGLAYEHTYVCNYMCFAYRGIDWAAESSGIQGWF